MTHSEHNHYHEEHCDCHEKHEHHEEHCDCHEKHEHHEEHCDCHEGHEHHEEHCDCHGEHEHHGHHVHIHREETIVVTSMMQDSAVVVSADYKVMADRQKLAALMTVNMESLASNLTAMGAFIGHIKASMDIHSVDVFSLTETEVHHLQGTVEDITIHLAAIVFAVEENVAKEMIQNMLEEIDRKVRN